MNRFFAEWTDESRAAAAVTPAAEVRESRAASRVPSRVRRAAVRATVLAVAGASVVSAAVLSTTQHATADPSASTWYRLRMCESSNNYGTNTGNGHYGAYQFDLATWRSVGGTGYPQNASPAEQNARALILYRERGWQPWQCAGILGLHEDADAGSGRISDIRIGSGTGHQQRHHRSSTPAFPGTRWYNYGDNNSTIKRFQDQMHRRGYFPPGTGQYGPLTLAMVKQLQRLNGLVPNGWLGPNTWAAAWTGRYTPPAAATATPVKSVTKHRVTAAPPFPGSRWYNYGDNNSTIKRFQDQMHRRGYFPPGTGQYGPLTLAMVKQLQRLNGLVPNGWLGPNTWAAAWTGRYHRAG